MVRWTLKDTLAFLLLLSLLLPSLLIMFISSTFKRPVSSWKALNLRKTLLMASSVRIKPLNSSRIPCVYAHETLTFLLIQKKTCVKNEAQKLRKTLLMASSVRLKPLNCSRLPCVYAQETLTFLLTQKKTCVKNYVQKE